MMECPYRFICKYYIVDDFCNTTKHILCGFYKEYEQNKGIENTTIGEGKK